jgi:hypothetical protein
VSLFEFLRRLFLFLIVVQFLNTFALCDDKMEGKNLSSVVSSDVTSPHLRKKSPFAHRYLKKSLEANTLDSNSVKPVGLLEDLHSDKALSLKASVNVLLEEIKLREDLNGSHFGKIDGEVSRLRVALRNLENTGYCDPRDLSGEVDESRFRIKGDVLELERERRKEGLECWRDLMFLKKYLMGALREYWDLVRRRGMLESG